jgi:hypothetical protein
MQTYKENTDRGSQRRIVTLGKARRHTQASFNEPLLEMAGDRTQRLGG